MKHELDTPIATATSLAFYRALTSKTCGCWAQGAPDQTSLDLLVGCALAWTPYAGTTDLGTPDPRSLTGVPSGGLRPLNVGRRLNDTAQECAHQSACPEFLASGLGVGHVAPCAGRIRLISSPARKGRESSGCSADQSEAPCPLFPVPNKEHHDH